MSQFDEKNEINLQPQTMLGKVVVVTGATSGIGEYTALSLAEKGATVVIVGRNQERIDSTIRKISQETSNPRLIPCLADLSSLKQVLQLASQILERTDRLDVLVNNAGANFFKKTLSPDGYEMTFAVNHLSYFYLTSLLLGTIQATAKDSGEARIINVASEAHRSAKLVFDDLMFDRRIYEYGGWRAYAQSKLANLLFTFELSRRLEGSPVTANAVHPGLVATQVGYNNGRGAKLVMKLVQGFAISPQEGAQTSIYLASWPEMKGVTGKYFYRCQAIMAEKSAYDPTTARRLWEISDELIFNVV